LDKGHFGRYLSMILIASIISAAFLVIVADDTAAGMYGDYRFFVDAQGRATIIGYSGPGGDITIPAKMLNGTVEYPTVGIGVGAFNGCTSLTTVTIPGSITTIGDYAFYGCDHLTSITIPDNVTYIGTYAFEECTSLTSIRIPDNLTAIGYATFASCFSLTSVTIPDSVKTIGGYAFIYCPSLRTITIPESVTSIGERAFFNCPSLSSITIPSNVTTIGDYAFSMCTSLTSITFLGLVAPTTVGADWILGTDAGIRGHAYAASNFPAPGDVFHGLTMGEVIPVSPVSDNAMLILVAAIAIAAVLVAVLFVMRKRKGEQ